MRNNLDVIVAILTLIYLGMAFSIYAFVAPVTTIVFIVGGVSLGIVVLYGILLSIAEVREKKSDQPEETARVKDQKKAPAKTMVWEKTVMVEEMQEGLGLPAL